MASDQGKPTGRQGTSSGSTSGQQRGGETSAREQRRDDQGQFTGAGGSQRDAGSDVPTGRRLGPQGDQGSGSSRGFAGMDDRHRRDAARRGGEASSQEQDRDDQGQFNGTGEASPNTN
jgi:hypothetical protein